MSDSMDMVRLEAVLGRIELDQRYTWEGPHRLVFWSRSRHYNGKDELVKTTEWSRGSTLIFDEPAPRRWWEFWK